MKLSLDKFKEMNRDDKLESRFESLQSIKMTNDTRLDRTEHAYLTVASK